MGGGEGEWVRDFLCLLLCFLGLELIACSGISSVNIHFLL